MYDKHLAGAQNRYLKNSNMTCLAMISVVFSVALTGIVAAAGNPKHVLLTVVDDLGFDDLGFR